MSGALRFGVLGPLAVSLGGTPVKLGGPKERLTLAVLLVAGGRVVSTEQLVDALWDEDPPDRAGSTLQVHVSNLRRRLAGGLPGIVTQAPGYLLPTSAADLDLLRFDDLVRLARSEGSTAPDQSLAHAEEALGLWRGSPLADLEGSAYLDNVRTGLVDRRLGVEEDRIRALLALGRLEEALTRTSDVLGDSPMRETLWELRILAMYRAGRQADALSAYHRCREILLDELGVEPTPRLRALEQAVLRQDPKLEPSAPVAAVRTDVTVTVVKARTNGRLVLTDGTAVALDAAVVIGRHPDCDVVVPDPAASRRHAEVRPALGGHLLVDLDSSNGTLVGGVPVVHHMLEPGDEIVVGDHVLRYERG